MFNKSNFLISALIATLLVFTAACGDDPENGNQDNQNNQTTNEHEQAGWVEIETRGAASEIIAVWDEIEGWQDAEGNAIDELPTPIDDEVDGMLPFTEMGPRASLTVRFFNPDGTEIEMSTLDRDDDTRVRTCSEYSARYFPADGEEETTVIYWGGLMRHPDDPTGPAQFIEIDDEPVGIFHCDHVHIYPQDAGEVDVEFVLWHGDHSDDVTDPITIRVYEEE